MPLYSYHCADCDNEVEMLVGMNDKAVCPSCGSEKMQQLMSRIAPDMKTPGIIKANRAAAAREGHLSNFSSAERRR